MPTERGRHLHDHRRRTAKDILEEAGEGCSRHPRGRRVRALGQRPGGAPQPDRRGRRARHHQGQADRQHRGLPADRRRGDRDRRALSHVRPASGGRWRGAAAVRVRQAHPRPVPAARALRRRPVRRDVRRRSRAQGLVPVPRRAARGRRPSRPARSSCGTLAPAGRSAPDIRASAAPSRTSGTR